MSEILVSPDRRSVAIKTGDPRPHMEYGVMTSDNGGHHCGVDRLAGWKPLDVPEPEAEPEPQVASAPTQHALTSSFAQSED